LPALLAELAFCADRAYMLDPTDGAPAPMQLDEFNFGLLPMVNGQSRLARRFYEEAAPLEAVRAAAGKPLSPMPRCWRWAWSPPPRTTSTGPTKSAWPRGARGHVARRADRPGGQPALRPAENMETRIFGRLTAWQNWIFQRPNAVGEKGALKVYGKGEKAAFDLNRV
jgi:benzoyl-CoA-dihydrodiol lyase